MSGKNVVDKKLVNCLSPSAQLVHRMLQLNKKMHVGEIKSKTTYSSRTIRYALRQLKNVRLVIQVPDMMDSRRHYYAITTNDTC